MEFGNGISNLRQLIDIIIENVDTIEKLGSQYGVTHPTIDDIYDPGSPSEKFTIKQDVLEASLLAISAASQLIATLKVPGSVLFDRANAFHVSSALRIASETGVVELLQEAGSNGVHVDTIASKTSTERTMIGRVLRLLATHYIFREIEPNIFVNNRISSMMDTGKTSDIILALAKKKRDNPVGDHGVSNVQGDKYIGTSGIPALVEQSTDEVFKSSAFLADIVLANDYSMTAFQKAMQFDSSMWEFIEKYPGYLQRIQMAMVGWGKMQPQQQNLRGFDWSILPRDSLIVDVGGGNGSESFEIAKKAPHLKIVIQDREQTIQHVTVPTWNNDPEKKKMIETGQVRLDGQDFFETQPSYLTNKVSAFFLRYITHDWPTIENVKILKQLRLASPPHCKLIIVDQLVPYACPHPQSLITIEGINISTPPAPLLANLGEANSDVYTADFSMATALNAQERTLGEFREMIEQSGWTIERIYQTVGSSISQIICVRS